MSSLPEGWVETSLGEVIGFVVDNRGKTPPLSEGKEYELLEVNAVGERSREPDYSKVGKFVDKNTFDTWFRKGTVKQGDVLIPTVGTIGNTAYSKQERGAIAQNLIALRANENTVPMFLYYFMSNPATKRMLLKLDIGGVQPSIKVPHLLGMQVTFPLKDEQKAIADMLSSFDEKIELLREQNKILETLAQTIFKEWFVNFNYPDATGEMVDSELGEIPKGWRVYELSELVDTVNGYSYKGVELVESSNEALVTLKSFNRNGGFQTRGFKPFSGTPKPQQQVLIGDLIVAHTDLTQDAEVLGNPAFVFENGGFEKMFITMDLVKVNSKVECIDNAFLYYVMKDRCFKGHCVGYSNGTTVLHMSKKAIPEYKLALPDDLRLAKDFSYIAHTLTAKISSNIKHLQNLEETRDVLLPQLMNGKIRV